MKRHFKAIFLFPFFLAASGLVLGDPLSTSPPFPKDQPIETKMDLGLFGLIGGGMKYTLGGKPIDRNEDFRSLIYPLHDTEASDLIRGAQDAHLVAWMFYVSGVGAGVDFALTFKPDPFLGVNWFDRIATGVVAAQFFWAVGALFDGDAAGQKFNAVQRYNHLLSGQEDAFLGFKPQVCQVGQALGLDMNRPF